MTLKYTKDHEWIKIEGEVVTLGITEHAAEALGELVYVEFPEVGDSCAKGDGSVVVESSKSASDVYVPVSGEVLEVNEVLIENPEKVNEEPYEGGWLIKLKAENAESELSDLMDSDAYQQYLSEEN